MTTFQNITPGMPNIPHHLFGHLRQ